MRNRRAFVRSLARTAAVFTFDQLLSGQQLPVQFVNVAREAGLRTKNVYGSEQRNKYLLETTGCGAAFFDYDNDGWLDIFLVNGTRFEAKWTAATQPVSRLYKNNRDGTFTDVTLPAGLARTGWGCGCCVGDYNNDGATGTNGEELTPLLGTSVTMVVEKQASGPAVVHSINGVALG